LVVVRRLEGIGARVEVLPARRDHLRVAFEQVSFDVFHLAAHGSYGDPVADAAAVLLDDSVRRGARACSASSAGRLAD
jgi:hypothetical protein